MKCKTTKTLFVILSKITFEAKRYIFKTSNKRYMIINKNNFESKSFQHLIKRVMLHFIMLEKYFVRPYLI